MAVEVHEVVRVVRPLFVAQHLLHARQGGRTAEVHAHAGGERIEGVEERLRREPWIDETRVGRAADDVEDAQRELGRARRGGLRLLQLPAHRQALGEAAFFIGQELPRQPQQRRIPRGEGQPARLRTVEKLAQNVAVVRNREQGVVQPVTPPLDLPFDTLRPEDRPAVGQLHVLLQIPAQVFVVLLGEEGRERDLDAEPAALGIGELSTVAQVFGGSEEDAEVLHACFRVYRSHPGGVGPSPAID